MAISRGANIIIAGTPGTGKSTHAEMLVKKIPALNLIDVNDVAKQQQLYSGYDEERKSQIVDEDRLVEAIEDDLESGNQVIDWHVVDVFPEQVIDLVVVLRTDNKILFDRLKARDYDEKKITENIDAEIMEVILNDARETYDEDVIVELRSDNTDDIAANVDRIARWYKNWNKQFPNGVRNIDLSGRDDSSSSSSDDDEAKHGAAGQKRA